MHGIDRRLRGEIRAGRLGEAEKFESVGVNLRLTSTVERWFGGRHFVTWCCSCPQSLAWEMRLQECGDMFVVVTANIYRTAT